MPRYKVTSLDAVTLVELEGTVRTRRFWWLGAVDALLLRGHRTFVVSLENTQVQSFGDARLVSAIAEDVRAREGRVVFVPPPGRRGGAKVRSAARSSHAEVAPTVALALAALDRHGQLPPTSGPLPSAHPSAHHSVSPRVGT